MEDIGFYQQSRLSLHRDVLPAATTGSWLYSPPNLPISDYNVYTATLSATDSQGNLLTLNPLAYVLDNVAPVVTVTRQIAQFTLDSSASILGGSLSDGGTASLTMLVEDGSGQQWSENLELTRNGENLSWIYRGDFTQAGTYQLTLLAVDQNGNQTSLGPYQLNVTNAQRPPPIYLPLIRGGSRPSLPIYLPLVAGM